jgi:hypothetical protein
VLSASRTIVKERPPQDVRPGLYPSMGCLRASWGFLRGRSARHPRCIIARFRNSVFALKPRQVAKVVRSRQNAASGVGNSDTPARGGPNRGPPRASCEGPGPEQAPAAAFGPPGCLPSRDQAAQVACRRSAEGPSQRLFSVVKEQVRFPSLICSETSPYPLAHPPPAPGRARQIVPYSAGASERCKRRARWQRASDS